VLDSLNRLWNRAISALASVKREEGQTMTEYAVVLTLIAVALVLSIGVLRDHIKAVIDAAAAAI
jgi:Flp pilus assembly pilin Flp